MAENKKNPPILNMPFSSNTRAKALSYLTKVYRVVVSWIMVRPSQFVVLLKNKELYKRPSYFPEYESKRKSPSRIFIEQLGQILRYGKVNRFYFQYGFDVKSKSEMESYVHYTPFQNRRGDLNLSLYHDYSCILRDKFVFSIFAEGIGIKVAKTLFYSAKGVMYDYKTKEAAESILPALSIHHRLFCKPLDGEEGKGIFIVEEKDGVLYCDGITTNEEKIMSKLTEKRYIVQTFIEQHKSMSQLHPESINTIRLVTVKGLKDGEIHVLPSILRIGTGDSVVDNTSQGGIAVGIDLDTGFLKKFGFYKPQYGLKADVHPNSNVRFETFQIPYFEEVKNKAIYFHSLLPQIHSVGWDIAIGEDGPVFVEGNDNWEITGPQSCNGGMKKEFKEFFYR